MNRYLMTLWFVVILFSGRCMAGNTVGFLLPQSGLGDQSFNDMAYAGLVKARNDFKFELIREKAFDNTEKSRKAGLEKLLSRGAIVVVANGWEFRTTVREASLNHPQVKFIINDVAVKAGDNLVSTVYGQHEASFLAGALTAWMTRTGKIGFIGGEDMPVIRSFFKGYQGGALYVEKSIDLVPQFLGDSDDLQSGFDNPALAYKTANSMYDNGVDIIFTVAGLSGNGAIRAAAERRLFVIGVDADQDYMAKGHVLTSVIKKLDTATYTEVAAIMNGKFSPGVHYYGLKEEGVALSPMTFTRDLIGPAIIKRLADLEGQIIKGKIVVTDILTQGR